MEALSRDFPQGLVYAVPFDTTIFVNASIHEVYKDADRSRRAGAESSSWCSCRTGALC